MKSSNHQPPGDYNFSGEDSDLKAALMLRSGYRILNLLSEKGRKLFRQNNGYNYMSYWSFICIAFMATLFI